MNSAHAASEERALRVTRVVVGVTVLAGLAALGWFLDWRHVEVTAVDRAKTGVEKVFGGHFHGDRYHGIPATECKCGVAFFVGNEAY